MFLHSLAIVGLWGVLIFSVVQLFREGAHIRQSDPVMVVPELEWLQRKTALYDRFLSYFS
jgi:hypothetical protein